MSDCMCQDCGESVCICPPVHHLKCWPEYFEKLASGEKTFEIRKNDRNFLVGHILHIREFVPGINTYTGKDLWFRVPYIMGGGSFGVEKDFVILALEPFKPKSKLVAHAHFELLKMGYHPGVQGINKWLRDGVLKLVETFALQGHSGGTAGYTIEVLTKLLQYEPLTPLTGEDGEWEDVSQHGDPTVKWQNKRCSRVLKGEDGVAFDVMARVLVFPDGSTERDRAAGSAPITFPYTPRTEFAQVPWPGEGVPG